MNPGMFLSPSTFSYQSRINGLSQVDLIRLVVTEHSKESRMCVCVVQLVVVHIYTCLVLNRSYMQFPDISPPSNIRSNGMRGVDMARFERERSFLPTQIHTLPQLHSLTHRQADNNNGSHFGFPSSEVAPREIIGRKKKERETGHPTIQLIE